MNRANDRRFPSDVCDVIYQQRNGRCQFSWVCTPLRNQEPRDLAAWAEAKSVARDALSNLPDLTGNALYFHDTSVVGWNHLRRTARIDNHIFYRDR
jgi:spore germination cell wall hydrolase CwlJ-like protein